MFDIYSKLRIAIKKIKSSFTILTNFDKQNEFSDSAIVTNVAWESRYLIAGHTKKCKISLVTLDFNWIVVKTR